MKEIIKLEKVSFCYKVKPILQDINLSIDKGDFIGIIGPNGGGKTTLLKLLMGMLIPHTGKIQIFGKNPKINRDKIGYVPQIYRIDKEFPISTLEVVLLGAIKDSFLGFFKKEIKNKAKDLLEKVGLKDFIDKPFGKLSGGQSQRALIARALISDPEILILDEPTANIDPESERAIFDILINSNKQRTILMVSHDLHTIVNEVKKVITVRQFATVLKPKEVCKHFGIGLYHTPIIAKKIRGKKQ
ncbi:MAG: High-affinity zinc uptake system ATP-binding protein ZnuC [Candidatus Anoxychlamydiales bacterium]|nr:High-affinity zinc uptake system ATP-binding protein ZnuC [Candidatus Anoxychlamydiales bacterium]NGX36230.1 High-affinity zinc uptake system ATP-binding protein ZnuC [Candidatus Anoxychlamydiales bacterium]